jgi:hypothetical protein
MVNNQGEMTNSIDFILIHINKERTATTEEKLNFGKIEKRKKEEKV